MPYAEVTDVLARAGVLAEAFDDDKSPVGRAEIETFLQQTGGELDAAIGAHGYQVPITDGVAAPALASVNADMALLLSLDANWPGSSARDDISDLRGAVQERVNAYSKQMQEGNLAALLYLAQQQGAMQVGGASNFWDTDGTTYTWWLNRLQTWPQLVSSVPEFYRGMGL